MTLFNRKIVEEILPGTFAKVIYQGPEGVIAAAPGVSTVAALGGKGHHVYQRAIEGEDPKAKIDENAPAAVYLPYTDDPEYSMVELGHKYCCDNGHGIEDLVAAACRSSTETALFLVKHGGLITECYPKEAYDDPAFCKASVALHPAHRACAREEPDAGALLDGDPRQSGALSRFQRRPYSAGAARESGLCESRVRDRRSGRRTYDAARSIRGACIHFR